jgi:hypothetical protein
MREYPENHQSGSLEILNREFLPESLQNVDFGLQVSRDGRVWVCIDGIAFLRFKPSRSTS